MSPEMGIPLFRHLSLSHDLICGHLGAKRHLEALSRLHVYSVLRTFRCIFLDASHHEFVICVKGKQR